MISFPLFSLHVCSLYTALTLITSVVSVLSSSSDFQASPRDLVLPVNQSRPNNSVDITSISNSFPECFEQTRDPRVPRLLPAKVTDCALVLCSILSGPHATIPLPWHEVAPQSPNYVRRWTSGTCSVAFQASSRDSRDSFPEMLVARQAALVMSTCKSRRTGFLGGKMLIGPRTAYYVIVGGERVMEPCKAGVCSN